MKYEMGLSCLLLFFGFQEPRDHIINPPYPSVPFHVEISHLTHLFPMHTLSLPPENFRKRPAPQSLFQWGCRPQVCSFIKKETLAQVFPCEFCEISKNTVFYRASLVAASAIRTQSL